MLLRVLTANASAVMCLKCRLVKVSTLSQKMFRFGRQLELYQVDSTRSLPVLLCKRSLITGTGKLAGTKMPYETDTNVAKDTLMYINDASRYFKTLSFFGVAQLAFWFYLAFFCHTNLKDAPAKVPEKGTSEANVSWWQKLNLGENKYRNGLTTICLLGGYLLFLISWTYPKRAVRQLWLLKGGESIGVVTYGNFGRSMNTVVPLNNMSCVISRESAVTQIPIKVKGKWLYHIVDMKGLFKEPKLFDCTAGLKRTLK